MKKTLLAIAIPALLTANAVSATELYADDLNTFSVGGHLSAGFAGSDEGETGVSYNSPRINFSATRDLGNGFTTDAKVEWAINMEGGNSTLTTRLGYLGLTHESYGRVVLGTQWAPTYDVALVTDMPIAFGNDFLYQDHGNLGTGRANDMASYRKSFSFDNAMALNLGFGAQGEQGDYDARYQAAISLDVAAFRLGFAYNAGDVNYTAQEETASIATVAAKYGSFGKGLYVAAVYAENEFTQDFGGVAASESTDMEALISYGFANSTIVSANYEKSTNDDTDVDTNETTALIVEHSVAPSVTVWAGYQIDLSDVEDNQWNIGGRIYL